MSAFVELPWRLYETDPNWIPPTKSALKRLLNPRKHPFWEFSERELFLAFRGSDVVGRIAAIVDGNHNRHHNERMGVWGFFECEHDPEAAAALFAAAERWLRGKTMVFIRGPLNPSANYEVGLLIQGFDTPPTLMMTYNPAYYAELVHFCGYRKEKDLYAYRIDSDFEPPEWSLEVAERFARKSEISIRRFTAKTLDADLRRMNAIYNECWGRNWGFVPMSEAELKETAREIKRILDPDFAFFLYYGNEPVGICLLLPDANPLLKRLNGRLGISALIKKYRYWSEVTGLRGLLFGVKERYRQTGVPLVAFDHLVRSFRSKEQYRYVELGWNLEDNQAINRLYEEGGARPTKRYRIYQKDLP
jgi:hypothetical protein